MSADRQVREEPSAILTSADMVRKLAWQRNGLLPWYSRMLLWSHLRGHPFGHGTICQANRDMRTVANRVGFPWEPGQG